MELNLVNLQKKITIESSQLTQPILKVLKRLKINKASLSFVFVGDAAIRKLNQRFLKRAYTTDVLAFNFLAFQKKIDRKSKKIYGEIIISTKTAVKNAREHQ